MNPADRAGRRARLNNRTSSVSAKGHRQPENPVPVFSCADRGAARDQSMQRCIFPRAAVPLLPLCSLHGSATGPVFSRTLTELQAEFTTQSSNSLPITVDGATRETGCRARTRPGGRRYPPDSRDGATGERIGRTNGDAMNVLDRSRAAAGPADLVAVHLGPRIVRKSDKGEK
jgi:hypothetical protein